MEVFNLSSHSINPYRLWLKMMYHVTCELSHFSHVRLFATPMDCSPPGSSVHGDSPGKKSGVGCHALLQGIFLTQGLNPCLLCPLHRRQILHCWATGGIRQNVCCGPFHCANTEKLTCRRCLMRPHKHLSLSAPIVGVTMTHVPLVSYFDIDTDMESWSCKGPWGFWSNPLIQ